MGILSFVALGVSLTFIAVFIFRVPGKMKDEPFDLSQKALLLVGIVVLLLAVLFAVLGPAPPVSQTAHAADTSPTGVVSATCVVFGFADGRHEIPATGLTAMKQAPDRCIDDVVGHLRGLSLVRLVLVGHVDKRDLGAGAERYYGNNPSLALQRAKAVLDALQVARGQTAPDSAGGDALGSRAILLSAGAGNVGEKVSPELLERDRGVEIRGDWSAQPSATPVDSRAWHEKFGSAVNATMIDPTISLALLALFVALSAYLATVRLFLQERNPDKSAPVRVALTVMTIADLPMIVATVLLGVHVFFFGPAQLVRASFILFLFGGFVMVLLHSREWIKSLDTLVEGLEAKMAARKKLASESGGGGGSASGGGEAAAPAPAMGQAAPVTAPAVAPAVVASAVAPAVVPAASPAVPAPPAGEAGGGAAARPPETSP